MPRFEPGPDARRGRGGRRPGAGRKPDKFKAKLRQIASSPAALKFLQDAIEGKEVDVRVVDKCQVQGPAPAATRAAIWESVHDRGFGKPVSLLEMKDEDGRTVLPAVVMLPARAPREKA